MSEPTSPGFSREQAIHELTTLAGVVASEWGGSVDDAADALRTLGVTDEELPVEFRSQDYCDAKDRADELAESMNAPA